MAVITLIQAQKHRGRYNIFLDGQFSFAVSEEVLINWQLHKGQELNPEQITQITNAEHIAKAYNKALDYLSYQLRTEKEMISYLQKHQFNDYEVEAVLKKLRSKRLIDDYAYAKSFVRTNIRTTDKGPYIIRQKLQRKGVLINDIDKALLIYTPAEQLAHAIKLGTKLIQHYRRNPYKIQLEKAKQALLMKGFSSDIINQALKNIQPEKNPAAEQEQLVLWGNKIWHRYQKYPMQQRLQKVKGALYRKGFNLDEIDNFLNKIQS